MPHACKFLLGKQTLTKTKPWKTELIKPVDEMLQYLQSEENFKNGYHLGDILTEVGVAQNSLQVAQVSQIAQVAQMRNLCCALCLFFSALAQFALRSMCVFSALAKFALRSMPFFSALAQFAFANR